MPKQRERCLNLFLSICQLIVFLAMSQVIFLNVIEF
jgi:hypothetical protein